MTEADPALRSRQAKTLSLRAVEPGIGVGLARPQALVEASEDHHVAGDQAGFEQAENSQRLVGRNRNANRHVGYGAIEEGAVVLAGHGRGVGTVLGNVVEQPGKGSAARHGPEIVSGRATGLCARSIDGSAVGVEKDREREGLTACHQGRDGAQGGGEAFKEGPHGVPVLRLHEADQAMNRGRGGVTAGDFFQGCREFGEAAAGSRAAQQSDLEEAGGPGGGAPVKSEAGIGMREQRHQLLGLGSGCGS